MESAAGDDLSYLHCPFLDPADYVRALAWLCPPAPPPVWAVPRPKPVPRLTVRDQAALAEWERRGFTEVERDVWLDAGLGRYESNLADHCRVFGISPPMLRQVVDGRRVAERLRSGESAASVAARLLNESA